MNEDLPVYRAYLDTVDPNDPVCLQRIAQIESAERARGSVRAHFPTLDQLELLIIETRIEAFGGNKTQAAKSLGICLKTLYNRLNTRRRRDASWMRVVGKWPTEPSESLYRTVRAAFALSGTSLGAWCSTHNVTRRWARHALSGTRKGPAAQELCARIVAAAKAAVEGAQ